MNEKPIGRLAGWRLLHSARHFENQTLKLREDRVEVGGSTIAPYAYIEKAQAVVIVPVTRDGQMVLIWQYRYPIDAWCWEVPAGGSHDTGDASLAEVARKELREEVGGTCERLEYITSFYSAPSSTDEQCHVYLAHDVALSHEPESEATESISRKLVPIEEALELARSGRMKTGPCALAVLLCESALRQFMAPSP